MHESDMSFFFFQAEDGIRDIGVTGVQTCALPIFGLLLYRIVRPSETVAEANERALAEEAMLVEVEAQPHCANCHRRVHAEWIICPNCRNRLRRVCPNCSRFGEHKAEIQLRQLFGLRPP